MIRQNQTHLYQESNSVEKEQEKVLTFPILMLSLLISSTFYVVPLSRVEYFGTDFHLFDFVFAFFFITVGLKEWSQVIALFKTKKQLFWWAGILLILSWLSLIITAATSGIGRLGPAGVRLIRFSAYFFSGAYVVVLVNTPRKLKHILTILYLNVVIQAILSTAQRLGWIGSFYSAFYIQAYGALPVGTLSAHHKQIGVVMLLGLGIGLTYLRVKKNLIQRIVNIIFVGLMFSASVFALSRTAWLGMAGMALGYLFIYKGRSIGMGLLLLIGLVGLTLLMTQLEVNILGVLEEDVNLVLIDRVERLGVEGLTSDRQIIYETVPNRIARNPWIIFVGTGFQNQSSFFYGSGAHNNYLHVWMELGIIGFIVYMGMLRQILFDLWSGAKRLSSKFEKTLAMDTFAVFIGILFTMLVGETLWAQPSMRTMTAQIMILVGLAVAPLHNWYKVEVNEDEKQLMNKTFNKRL